MLFNKEGNIRKIIFVFELIFQFKTLWCYLEKILAFSSQHLLFWIWKNSRTKRFSTMLTISPWIIRTKWFSTMLTISPWIIGGLFFSLSLSSSWEVWESGDHVLTLENWGKDSIQYFSLFLILSHCFPSASSKVWKLSLAILLLPMYLQKHL